MIKQIWKFKIKDSVSVKMPIGAEILSLQLQDGEPHIWVLVNPNELLKFRIFDIYNTGQSIKYEIGIKFRKYIGTYQDGQYVYHVFERMQ